MIGTDPTNLEAQRLASLGRLLGLSWAVFERRVVERVRRGGYADFRPPHASLTRSMGLEGGTRLSVLAKRAGVTKQAMGQLAREAERKGWVRLKPDPEDGRAKLVSYTKKGLRLAAVIVEAAGTVEREFSEIVGKQSVEGLRTILTDWLDAAFPEHESYWSLRRLASRHPSRAGERE